MIRLLAIPVAGTILAFSVILLAHSAREEEKTPAPHEFTPPESPLPHEGEEEPEEPNPPPTPQTFYLELQPDGSYLDLDGDYSFTSVEDLEEQLKDIKHTIVLTKAPGVPPSARRAAAAQLGKRYIVEGPQPLELKLELQADGGFFDLEHEQRYTSLDDLLAQLPDARHTIALTNATGVSTSALDAAVANLSAHYTVRRIERAPDK